MRSVERKKASKNQHATSVNDQHHADPTNTQLARVAAVPAKGVMHGPVPAPSIRGNLPLGIRQSMERKIGDDFSNVRVHKNSRLAEALSVPALTRGDHVHLSAQINNPYAGKERNLLAHELLHVKQQRQGRVHPTHRIRGLPVNREERLESEAIAAENGASSLVKQGDTQHAIPSINQQNSVATDVIQCAYWCLDANNALSWETKNYKPPFLKMIEETRSALWKGATKTGPVFGTEEQRAPYLEVQEIRQLGDSPAPLHKNLAFTNFNGDPVDKKPGGTKVGAVRRLKGTANEDYMVKVAGGYQTAQSDPDGNKRFVGNMRDVNDIMAIREAMAGDLYKLISGMDDHIFPETRLVDNDVPAQSGSNQRYMIASKMLPNFQTFDQTKETDLSKYAVGITKAYITALFLGETDIKNDNIGRGTENKVSKIDHGESLNYYSDSGKKLPDVSGLLSLDKEKLSTRPVEGERVSIEINLDPEAKNEILQRIASLDENEVANIIKHYAGMLTEFYGPDNLYAYLIGRHPDALLVTVISRIRSLKKALAQRR